MHGVAHGAGVGPCVAVGPATGMAGRMGMLRWAAEVPASYIGRSHRVA